jgi:hypothetical protein
MLAPFWREGLSVEGSTGDHVVPRATIGSLSSTPRPVRIGIEVGPNASNASCDSQMPNTLVSSFISRPAR